MPVVPWIPAETAPASRAGFWRGVVPYKPAAVGFHRAGAQEPGTAMLDVEPLVSGVAGWRGFLQMLQPYAGVPRPRPAGFVVAPGSGGRLSVARALGRRMVTGVVLEDGTRIPCDCVLVSGGFTATVHLHAQAKGRLRWDDARLSFVPEAPVAGLVTVGAAAGHFALAEALAALPETLGLPDVPVADSAPYDITPLWPRPGQPGRVWIDLQHDVTAKDVELAARENMVSVEHLKRYTTPGMATDQGKTSNLAGMALMGALTGRSIPAVGLSLIHI